MGISYDYRCNSLMCKRVLRFDTLLVRLGIAPRSDEFYFGGVDICSSLICESLRRGSSYEG